MNINFNIGILGHVDSGKTTLAKVLSNISSTAAFDKNPQSKERGITLDLGFSSLILYENDIPEHIKSISKTSIKRFQFTFVDCPGHASLIRTIIGGASIIDLMVLVIDAQKGIQTQTAECLVIGELTCKKLIVAINKIDSIDETIREKTLTKLKQKIYKVLETTNFGLNVEIFAISALYNINIKEFIDGLKRNVFIPERNLNEPFLFYVDHCFAIKGQGTICTGTVIHGKVSNNDTIEIPLLKEMKKIKSIQMFREPVDTAQQGDRIGLCVTQFNSDLMERGIIAAKGYVTGIYAAIIKLNKIKYYKNTIKSKSKFHITIGHETVMAKITIFRNCHSNDDNNQLELNINQLFEQDYEYIDEITDTTTDCNSGNNYQDYILLEFEIPVFCAVNSLLIASKLDIDIHTKQCRLAFWGNLLWTTNSSNYLNDSLVNLKVYKNKIKQGNIQRIINENEVIVQNLFKKESKRDLYIGKKVQLSTGEIGIIESTFGQTSKVKIRFMNSLNEKTLDLLKTRLNDVLITLKFKKYIFDKNKLLVQ